MDFSDFKDIEEGYETTQIKFLGVSIWPFLRIYAFDQINRNVSSGLHKASPSFFKDLFWKFPSFSQKEYIVFSSSDQRKLINNLWHDRQDISPTLNQNALFVELPVKGHKPQQKMASKYYYSKLWWYAVELLVSKFLKTQIEKKEILEDVLAKLNCSLNYHELLVRFKAQFLVSKFFFKLYRPKAVFLTTAYTNMARILAAKACRIKVVEFQHGLISEKHNAYAIGSKREEKLTPDFLLSFGAVEKEILEKNNYLPKEKVLPIGSFYLGVLQDKIGKENPIKVEFPQKKIFCFTAQDMAIEKVIQFLNLLSEDDQNLVLFLPRKLSIEDYYKEGLLEKVRHLKLFDTYQTLLYSDFHLTMFSTCATEAIALGTPTILLDFDEHATKHFGSLVQQLQYLGIIKDFDDLTNALTPWQGYDANEVSQTTNHLYKVGYQTNLEMALKTILSE